MGGRNIACHPANRTELIGLGEVGFANALYLYVMEDYSRWL